MDNRSTGLFNDSRMNVRVEDNCDIVWKEADGKNYGRGKVRNISASGMLLETKTDCVPGNDSVLYFEPVSKKINYIPESSRLVWHRKKRFSSNAYEYGIKFSEPSESVLVNLRQKIQKAIVRLMKVKRIETVINVLLILLIVGITSYAVWINTTITNNIYESNQKMSSAFSQQTDLTNNFNELFKVTEIELQNTEAHLAKVMVDLDATMEELNITTGLYNDGQQMLKNVNAELAETKRILTQTQQMMAQNKETFENDIGNLTMRNEELTKEMYALQEKLDYYEGDIKNLKEGSDLLSLYQIKMKLVKSKIKVFKREAEVMRKAAMVERDRIQMIIGNNGYLVKDGSMINTDMDSFYAASLSSSEPANISKNKSDVKINVMIVE